VTSQEKENIHKKIQEALDSLEGEITALQEQCKPISPECALGDLARFELMHDQVVSEKGLNEAQARRIRLQYALSNIHKKDFGLCVECEEEIAYKRLLLLPESRLCIDCAKTI